MPKTSARRPPPIPRPSFPNIVVASSLSSTLPAFSSSSAEPAPRKAYRPIHPLHSAELSALWPADPRIPTPASRTAWALARDLNPINVNAWWYRRRKVAKKLRVKIPRDEYVLDIGTPPVIPEVGDDVVVKVENDVEVESFAIGNQPYWSLQDGTPPFLKFPTSDDHASPWSNLETLLSQPLSPRSTPKPDPLDAYMELCNEIETKRRAYTHFEGTFLPSVDILSVVPVVSFPQYPSWESFAPTYSNAPQNSDSSPATDKPNTEDETPLPSSSPLLTSSSPLLSSPIGLHINLPSFEVMEDSDKGAELERSTSIDGLSCPPSPATSSSVTSSASSAGNWTGLPPSSSSMTDTMVSDDPESSLQYKPSSATLESLKVSSPLKIEKRDFYTNPCFGSALIFPTPLDPSLFGDQISDTPAPLDVQKYPKDFDLDGLLFTLDGVLVSNDNDPGPRS